MYNHHHFGSIFMTNIHSNSNSNSNAIKTDTIKEVTMLVTEKHLSKSFDNDLNEVIELFMQMGRMAAEQVMIATRALIAADEATAKKVIADDDLINQLEIKIDEQIILLVAKRQPAANDLRLVMAISKGIVVFERVGD